MKCIIDTRLLIWLAVAPEKISTVILEIIENPENKIFVSTVNLWEIAIKLSLKKLDLQNLDIDDLVDMCCEQGLEIIQLPIAAVKKYRDLPVKERHKDPFDRLLISLCIAGDYVFLSSDSKVGQYKVDGLKFIS